MPGTSIPPLHQYIILRVGTISKMAICGSGMASRRRGFDYFVFYISHFVLLSPLVGRNNIGRRSSVRAVRARPLLIIKKNIEPDELREEADTIPTRGVNPESRSAPGLRPTLYTSVGLRCVASLRRSGLGVIISTCRGLRPCLCYFAPQGGYQIRRALVCCVTVCILSLCSSFAYFVNCTL